MGAHVFMCVLAAAPSLHPLHMCKGVHHTHTPPVLWNSRSAHMCRYVRVRSSVLSRFNTVSQNRVHASTCLVTCDRCCVCATGAAWLPMLVPVVLALAHHLYSMCILHILGLTARTHFCRVAVLKMFQDACVVAF